VWPERRLRSKRSRLSEVLVEGGLRNLSVVHWRCPLFWTQSQNNGHTLHLFIWSKMNPTDMGGRYQLRSQTNWFLVILIAARDSSGKFTQRVVGTRSDQSEVVAKITRPYG